MPKSRSAEMPSGPNRRQVDFKAQQQAQHTATISLIAKNTVKIQKEIGFRRNRLKKVYQNCTEAIEALNKFKDEPWSPPKQLLNAREDHDKNDKDDEYDVSRQKSIDLNSSKDIDEAGEKEEIQTNGAEIEKENKNEENDCVEEVSTVVSEYETDIETDVETRNESEEIEEGYDEGEVVTEDLDDGMDVDTVVPENPGNGDAGKEAHGQEIVPEVRTAISCYCLAVTHPQASAKMIEIALECIGLLISNRYVVGSTTDVKKTLEGLENDDEFKEESDVMQLINCICECADNASDAVQNAMIKDLLSLMTSPVCAVHGAGMLKAVRTVFHVYLITKHDDVKQTSRAVLLDMLRSVFQRMEAYDAMAQDDTDECVELPRKRQGTFDEEEIGNLFASRFHTDSYLLFRALCKLSAKPLPEDMDDEVSESASSKGNLRVFTSSKSSISDPMATATKILSLELILCVFEHCGTAFRSGEKFIWVVQNFLCVSLLKNCVSSNTKVAHLSLKVFLLLVYKFKNHMKAEIEVFIANVFLPVLESPNCPFERKSLVLEALRALCADPIILTSIFLNYDCDFDAVNLYKTIVHHLTSLSVKGRSVQTPSSKTKSQTENFSLSVAGLEVFVVILQGFLKALDLPGGDDNFDEERSKVRGSLQLDVGMAVKAEVGNNLRKQVSTDEMAVTAEEIENIESSPSAEDVAGKIVDAFDKKRAAQQNFELGVIKFKLSAKQGLLFFVQSGLLHLDAYEIASFFYEHKEILDKTQIGEVFGREPDASFVKGDDVDPEKGGEGFYIRVLHHYVDSLDFSGLKFDDAIRLFLSGFRLPGESQKVDRIMEKFAERFTLQNEDVFPSADTAFILAFAVIMLQTDLHNPNIKPEKKMTEESFVNMNKGISVDGGDLPEGFLIDIYRSIKERPFTLKEDEDARKSQKKSDENGFNDVFFGTAAEERRRQNFKKERAELVESTKHLFGKQKPNSSADLNLTSSVNPSDVVKPMFDITWGPLLGALSQILEKADDESSIALCLNGFVYAVRIASNTRTTLARSTFVNSLAKFTALGSIRELKARNIESIRTLLSIAIMDGEYLGDSWMPILQCISQLGRLLFFASGVDSDDNFLNTDASSVRSTQTSESRETEEINGRVVLEAINEVLIEKVFSGSTKLSETGALNLIECLVSVSVSEIAGDSKKAITGVGRSIMPAENEKGESQPKQINAGDGPRVYSLQKLVEVADYNMHSRSRLSWAKIWDVMAGHFVEIGCNENAMVSMFAIDALRQLSSKFLEKVELADFNFQRSFLQPFLSVMENSDSRSDTRELILQCVGNTIRSSSHNIRSGWKIFFAIISLSANDPSGKNCSLGLSILQHLVDDHLDSFCPLGSNQENGCNDTFKEEKSAEHTAAPSPKELLALAEDFIGLCRTSNAFIDTTKPLPMALTVRAFCHMGCYADTIASGSILPPLCNTQSEDPLSPGYTFGGLSPEEGREMILWRPIIDGLAAGICSTVSSNDCGVGCFVQRGSVITLRSILLRYASTFTPAQVNAIMSQSILPAIETAAKNDNSPVMKIISESPSVSNLDFLTEPLALPPPVNDEGLLHFATVANMKGRDCSRPMGNAELLVEASLVDLKHAGNGDLSQAYALLEKTEIQKNIEEPFPDSWVATTGPIALGMLTDIFCLFARLHDASEAKDLWPVTVGQMQKWSVGSPFGFKGAVSAEPWTPCEALVRIGCKEIAHLSETVFTLFPGMDKEDVAMWLGFLCRNLADTLSYNIELEGALHLDVLEEINLSDGETPLVKDEKEIYKEGAMVDSPYGKGTLAGKRIDAYDDVFVDITTVELEHGATLYNATVLKKPQFEENAGKLPSSSLNEEISEPPKEVKNSTGPLKMGIMKKYISPLRVRCTSIYCVQQSLFRFLELFSTHCSREDISVLLDSVELSRAAAARASVDKSLGSYFEEAMRMEWGGGVEGAQAAFSSDSGVGHLGRCEMFFLTQEASANNVLVRLLSLLYTPRGDKDANEWDTFAFSEPLLMSRITDVLQKFIVSERENGHKLDPNVWRAASESGTKFAIHCTSFATVVVNILYTILGFTDEQFERQKATLFPVLCSLISIQSEEIRMLVAEILNKKVSVLLGIERT